MIAALAAASCGSVAGGPAWASPAPTIVPVISASASASQVVLGTPVTVSGRLSAAGAPAARVPLELQVQPYPLRRFRTLAHGASDGEGRFRFAGLRITRDSRLRVIGAAGNTARGPVLTVTVDPRVQTHARRLGAGRTRLSVRIWHTPWPRSAPVPVHWFVQPRGGRTLRLATVTATRELGRGLTYAEAVVEPPARHFDFRICLNPRWERAMGSTATHGPCPSRSFSLGARARARAHGVIGAGQARGIPMAAYPGARAVAGAARVLGSRAGRTAFAVIDNEGRLAGLHVHEHFQSASVVKVMMLVAYLQTLAARHRGLRPSDNALLYPMIHVSDNNAASAVLEIVGQGALERVARESQMSDYAPGVGWWAYTQTSAADQARLLFALPRLIPPQFYAYARGLLAGIEPSQSWGVPPVARPRWQVFFKTGALPSQGLFDEAARLERPGVTFAVAVFTDREPSMAYGEQTIEDVAAALLRSPPRPARSHN
jgi:hypothetical protein